MTKMKSKKMTKSTFAIIIMAIAMVALMAFGGTYAYFTATTGEITNRTLTTATVQLGQPTVTTITETIKVVPGMGLLADDESISIVNSSNTEVWIFVELEVSAEKDSTAVTFKDKDGETIAAPFDISYSKTGENANFTKLTGVTGVDNVYYVKTSAASVDFADQITLSTSVYSQSTPSKVGDVMDATVVITITAQAIQTEGLTTPDAAYEAL